MVLSVNNYSNQTSFGNKLYVGRTMPTSKISEFVDNFKNFQSDITVSNKGSITLKTIKGKIIEVLSGKPYYVHNSEKKMIAYPVMIDGKPQDYVIKYPVSQNAYKRVGSEILDTKPEDMQFLSAREIARDIDKKAEVAQKRENGINVFYHA